MNATEKKYVIKRIDCLFNEKKNAIMKQCQRKGLSDDEKLDLVYSGKVPLLPRNKVRSFRVIEAFDFTTFEPDNSMIIEEETTRLANLQKERMQLQDFVMLGNTKEALSMLQEFEEKEF